MLKSLGQLCGTAENRDAGALPGVVDGHPADATYLIGQPVAQLCHKTIRAPRHADSTLEINSTGSQHIEGLLHSAPQPGIGNGTNNGVLIAAAVVTLAVHHHLEILAHIHVGALISGPQQFHDVGDVDRIVGFYAERKLRHIVGKALRRSQSVEDKVLALAEVLAIGPRGIEGFPEAELALTIPKEIPLGHLLNIVGAHEKVRIIALQLANTRDVTTHGHVVVGHTLSSPHGANLRATASDNLHLPHLFLVGNGNALATVGIAVFLCQLGNELDSLAGRSATLQGNTLQFLDEKHGIRILQRIGAAESALSNGQLLLVEAGVRGVEVGVGVLHLADGAGHTNTSGVARRHGMHRALAHLVLLSFLVVGRRLDGHPRAVAPVAGVRRDDTPVGTRPLTHHDGGAALFVIYLRRCHQRQRNGQKYQYSFHSLVFKLQSAKLHIFPDMTK